MEKGYTTLVREGRSEYYDRRSRFLGIASPLDTIAEAEAWLAGLRRAYPDARHHVFAYVFVRPQQFVRFSDDGEPHGTAGPPLLDSLKHRGLAQCGVAVVRYFGGTLLGKGGLVRAYGQTAQLALDEAGRQRVEERPVLTVRAGYDRAERLREGLLRDGLIVSPAKYGLDVRFEVAVPADRLAAARERVLELSAGQAEIEKVERQDVAIPLSDDQTEALLSQPKEEE